jgi:hypothetical protein
MVLLNLTVLINYLPDYCICIGTFVTIKNLPEMKQELQFYLKIVFLQDKKTGDVTAFFAQFPDAAAQGRNEDEAQKLLFEIFPHMMKEKEDELAKYHPIHFKEISFREQATA